MKFAVVLALFAFVAVSLAQPVAEAAEEGSPAAAAPEKREAVVPAEAAGDGKDLDTANSYLYGGYPAYYGGYGGYGAYGIGYGAYPYYAYGAYGGYHHPYLYY